MITQQVINYAKVLYSLDLSSKCVEQARQLLTDCRELLEVLQNPVIRKQEKEEVINSLFDREIVTFLKVLCENGMIGAFEDIAQAYEAMTLNQQNILKAKLSYAVKPEDEQLKQIRDMLCDKYNKSDVLLETQEQPSLIGGYVLNVGNTEYDKSIRGTLAQMQKTLIGR